MSTTRDAVIPRRNAGEIKAYFERGVGRDIESREPGRNGRERSTGAYDDSVGQPEGRCYP
jgi:hypothetical protein